MRWRWTSACLYRPFALGMRSGSSPTPELPGQHGNVGGSCKHVYCFITAHSYRFGPGYSGPVVSSRTTSGHSRTSWSCRNSGAFHGVHAIRWRCNPYARGRRQCLRGYLCTINQYSYRKADDQSVSARGTPRAGPDHTASTPMSGVVTRPHATCPTSTTCPPTAVAGHTTPATRPGAASATDVARTAHPTAASLGSTLP